MTKRLPYVVLLVVSLSSWLAYGQAAPAPNNATAHAHFNRGVAHAGRGQLGDALREFEAAYRLEPHYSVLYNIGRAHAALGHPAEAVRAFERYLVEGANRLSQLRRDQVRGLIASNRGNLGELRLVGISDATRVWVDGIELEQSARQAPLLLAAGKHSVLSSNGGGFPTSQEVVVAPATVAELRLVAAPQVTTAPPSHPAGAQLRVICDLPGVTIEVGGKIRAVTPLAVRLTVEAGPFTVRFSRPGYRPVTHHVAAPTGGAAIAPCDQVREDDVTPAARATLVVRTVPLDAELFVDGERFLGGPLPYGPHELRIERDGFVAQRRPISLRPRAVTTYQIALVPTAARQAETERLKSRRKLAGYATGGGGLALAIAGVALLGWNGGRYDAWKREHSAAVGGQLQSVASIQRVDDIAVGCTALGAALTAVGGWLLLTEPAQSH